MSRSLELPEPIYDALIEIARASSVAPADWIASKLPREPSPPGPPNESSALSRRLLRHAGAISLPRPTGTDNDAIDADLGAYAESHEE